MADRYSSAVLFAMEKNLTFLYAHLTFGAAGAVTLDTQNSKGFCNASLTSVAFTATSSNGSGSLTAVSSFAGIYPGMTIKDAGPTHVNQVLSSANAGAGTMTLAGNATGTNTGLFATGGSYTLQLGRNAGVNLDTYYKLLMVQACWDESGSQGGASSLALAPAAPVVFLSGNNSRIRTIPGTAATALTDATLTITVGTGTGTSFVAAAPASGEGLYLAFAFGNCSAP